MSKTKHIRRRELIARLMLGVQAIMIAVLLIACIQKPKIKVEYVDVITEVPVIEYVEVEVEVPVIEYVEVPVVEYVEVEVQKKYYNVTAYERDILAKTVYLEARGESKECQLAVCSVIMNRVEYGYGSIDSMCHDVNQFSVAPYVDAAKPTQNIYDVVDEIIMNGPTVPKDVLFFRAKRFHNWKTVEDWKKIDNTYFSRIKKY